MKKTADFANDLAAQQERVLYVIVRHQIQVTLAVTDFRIRQAMPFLGRRTQGLCEDDERVQLHADLTRLGGEHRSLDPDEIPQIQVLENSNCSSPSACFCA